MKIKTVYLDLDGVLADFEKEYDKRYKNLKDTSVEELLVIKKTFADIHFFRSLPLMKDAKKLVKMIEKYPVNLRVLTSVGKWGSKDNAIDKVLWLKQYFPKLASKFDYVKTSTDKARFAKPDVLLVDDRLKSTKPFKAAGGETVFYKNFKDAEAKIKKYLENDK